MRLRDRPQPCDPLGGRVASRARREEGREIEHLTTSQQLLVFAVWAAGGVAVFLHADRHGSRHPTAWGISVVLAFAIMLPVYIIHVYLTRRRARRG